MATIRKEIITVASVDDVWAPIRDVGALHTRHHCRVTFLGRLVRAGKSYSQLQAAA
jgi:hypothetical protein